MIQLADLTSSPGEWGATLNSATLGDTVPHNLTYIFAYLWTTYCGPRGDISALSTNPACPRSSPQPVAMMGPARSSLLASGATFTAIYDLTPYFCGASLFTTTFRTQSGASASARTR